MKGKALLFLLLAIVTTAAVGLGVTTYLFYDKYNKEKLKQELDITADEVALEDTSEEDPCAPVMNQFTGEEVNISFEYPATWGEAEETVIDTETGGYISGKSVHISFTDNSYVNLHAASSDFEIGGIGGPCPIWSYFQGDEDMSTDTICTENISDFDPTGLGMFFFSCNDENIGDEAISYFYGPTGTCSDLGFQNVVDINSPQAEYPGVRIITALTRVDNANMANLGERMTSSCTDQSQVDYLEGLYMDIWNGVYDEIVGESYNDYLMQKQLEEIEVFLETVEFEE